MWPEAISIISLSVFLISTGREFHLSSLLREMWRYGIQSVWQGINVIFWFSLALHRVPGYQNLSKLLSKQTQWWEFSLVYVLGCSEHSFGGRAKRRNELWSVFTQLQVTVIKIPWLDHERTGLKTRVFHFLWNFRWSLYLWPQVPHLWNGNSYLF